MLSEENEMKPRNFFAVYAHFRKGGAHGKTNKANRKQGKQNLQKELRSV
jgi:hypothetical protein